MTRLKSPGFYIPLIACLSVSGQASAQDTTESIFDLGLEDLLSLEVTSVSKKKQRLDEAAAAIYVITGDDIRRSGVTTIADALRMAPGVQVARIDSNKWAVSARGFNGQFANKLLVLMDGRSVYTSSYSGVYWEDQDTMLEDIDRIEVIRGPVQPCGVPTRSTALSTLLPSKPQIHSAPRWSPVKAMKRLLLDASVTDLKWVIAVPDDFILRPTSEIQVMHRASRMMPTMTGSHSAAAFVSIWKPIRAVTGPFRAIPSKMIPTRSSSRPITILLIVHQH